MFGNALFQKYLKSAKFVKSATAGEELRRFQAVVALFKKYGAQYNLDYLLMMAQGFQESGLNQDAKSPVGAIGVMQVMPATGKDLKVGDITNIDANINAGVKYIRFMIDKQFADDPADRLNKGLFAFAAYNCGPGRLRQLRREAASKGLNPNVWFNNVERIAGARIGRETVQYVSNIYKYYVAYTLMQEQEQDRAAAKQSISDADRFLRPARARARLTRWVRTLRLSTYSDPPAHLGRVHEVLVLEHRQEHDPRRIRQSRQSPGRVETAHTRHRDVEHDGVGFEGQRGGDRRFAVQCRGDDLEFAGELMADDVRGWPGGRRRAELSVDPLRIYFTSSRLAILLDDLTGGDCKTPRAAMRRPYLCCTARAVR